MKVIETALPGVAVITPRVFEDERGYFQETFSAERYQEVAGIDLPFVQDNHSRSRQNTLRGLHFQRTRPQGKLVYVAHGSVFDVVADINPESETFAQHVAVILSDLNHQQLYIPPGYAHGFCVVSKVADVVYKCTDYYQPGDDEGVAWNCPDLSISWPTDTPLLSNKDRQYPFLRDLFQARE